MMESTLQKKIIIALDVNSESEAHNLIAELGPYVGGFKLGLELLNSIYIKPIIDEIKNQKCLSMYDGKFLDIPNTIAGASQAVTKMGVSMFTIHTLGGIEMIRSAVTSSREEAKNQGMEFPPMVIGVTILTSINQQIMNSELNISGDLSAQVVHLAKLADGAGVDAIVCSPLEIAQIRANVSNRIKIISPGIRPRWAASNDQKRVLSPAEAIKQGADYLVIGRPITKPPIEIGSRIQAIERIIAEIASDLQ